jgi:soluble lytic murein transglycosylase
MQVMTRILAALTILLTLAHPAWAERPRPLGWALEAMRSGNWANAARIAERDGEVAADIIEWHRLRAGGGDYEDVLAFLERRPDWPGEAYLRLQAEEKVIAAGQEAVLSFFADGRPQTGKGVLALAEALMAEGRTEEAEKRLVSAWRGMSMNASDQAAFAEAHPELLKPHHEARLEMLLWEGEWGDARRLYDLVSDDAEALAEVRIALQKREGDVNAMIDALPKDRLSDPGLAHDRFEWRLRKGLTESATELMLETSVSAEALGRPGAWANRRRALARADMRAGNAERAYQLASRHYLTDGSHYADLEWLSGYLALRFLDDPRTAYQHFQNHDAAVQSPISQGRAGYWQGRALEAMGDPEGASVAYAEGAKYQTSFYGLLAAEKASIPFDAALEGAPPAQDWRQSPLADRPLFQAGLLLQASGELNLAERFWTHLAESLPEEELALLGQAAIDADQPHLAVMIGKRAAQRGLEVAAPYYPLHSLVEMDLPIAPEMALAIARRESEFDPVVISHAGARGLMQLLPGTAQDVASDLSIGSQHSTERLTENPDYNARLGSTYLAQMARRFDGNVVMVSAAYNAGPARPPRWIAQFGDPRRGDIDVVDWIEMVPFRETQNYIMRVAESLPVYRARLGLDPLPIPFSEELTGATLKPLPPEGE